MNVSPLAPAAFPAMPEVAGVRLAAGACGLRYRGRDDLVLIELAPGTAVAGVFTRSRTAAAPVLWCREALAGGRARAVVVNSGNANAFTGAFGDAGVRRSVAEAARLLGAEPDEIFVASTGVIGETLDDGRIVGALSGLCGTLRADAWQAAARAIMTTDTFAKGATRQAKIDDVTVTVAGIAKGSGMIAPDMATMLAFVVTDATLSAPVLQQMLGPAVDRSFNSITVDGDTSTNDTVLLFATGKGPRHAPAGRARLGGASGGARAGEARLRPFRAALEGVLLDLAQQVVRDGEGARKFVTIAVTGAASARAARRVGLAIANSPLVKTAIAGADANWGRIVMAVGKAGEKVAAERLAIRIGGVPVAEGGHAHPDYRNDQTAAHMKGREIAIAVDLGVGRGRAEVWTCDLTHGYIDINADYRS